MNVWGAAEADESPGSNRGFAVEEAGVGAPAGALLPPGRGATLGRCHRALVCAARNRIG